MLGHSYGGAVALAWALDAPKDTAALVTLAGPIRPWDTPLGAYYSVLSNPLGHVVVPPLLVAYLTRRFIRRQLDALFTAGPVPPGLSDYLGADLAITRSALRANAGQRATLLGEIRALQPRLAEFSLPWEVLHGTADPYVWASLHTANLEKDVPSARVTLLDGIGHMPEHEAEDQVIAAILRAAARVDAA